MDTKTKEQRIANFEKELIDDINKKIIPEATILFATKDFASAITYAVAKGINFAVRQMKKGNE